MAKPKVFVSSTCYDLGEVRDSLMSFIVSFGFEPVLSEHGDVFYHPELHTHDACIHEVGNCQLFILLIGGRFGGSYVNDPKKSVTNAEYEAAVANKLPVFTYVKRNVIDNHNLYQTNKSKAFVEEIDYPAIDKQNHSKLIFEFINRVRRARVNNAYEPFEVSRDIESHLRKQWAGMFFDFLRKNEVNSQIESTSEAVNNIKYASSRLENLIAEIYKVVDKNNAPSRIKEIETLSLAKKFLEDNIGEWNSGVITVTTEEANRIRSVNPSNFKWYEYLVEIGILEIRGENDESIDLWTPASIEFGDRPSGYVGLSVSKGQHEFQAEVKYNYENGLKKISAEFRKELLEPYLNIVD